MGERGLDSAGSGCVHVVNTVVDLPVRYKAESLSVSHGLCCVEYNKSVKPLIVNCLRTEYSNQYTAPVIIND
jgi:hypothetical protein